MTSLAILLVVFTAAGFGQGIYWTQGTYGSSGIWRATSNGTIIGEVAPDGRSSLMPEGIQIDTAAGMVFWVNRNYDAANVFRSAFDLSTTDSISGNASTFRGVALDLKHGRLYWTSTDLILGPRIYSSNLDGTGMSVMINFYALHDSSTTPRGIAVDTVDGKVYWTSDATGTIQRSNTDGTTIETVTSGLTNPVGIALDMIQNRIYWTECNNPAGTIKRGDLIGGGSGVTNITALVSNASSPYAIALDKTFGKVYWTELGGSLTSPRIERSNLDGTGPEVVADNLSDPFGLAVEVTAQPLVVGESVSATTMSSATLYATVIPNGSSSSVQFLYGTSSAYGSASSADTVDDPGTALSFNGTSTSVNAGTSSSFNLTGQFTIEGWFKVSSFTDGWQAIVTKGDGAWRVQRYNGTDNLDFGTNGLSNQDLQGSANVNDGDWHHFAAVYDGSNKYLYVDGTLDAEAAVTGSLSTDSYAVSIGSNAQVSSRNFDGLIDEVRIWNAALDSTTIQEWMNRNIAAYHPYYSSLVGYWQCNDGSGTIAHDASGHGFNGTLVGSPAWTSVTRECSVHAALTGLASSTTYHYSLEATNAAGATTTPDLTFMTAGPLPVQLASLKAAAQGLNAVLQWQTSTEVDNEGWQVEREAIGYPGTPKTDWETAGFVKGAGTSTHPVQYSFTDRGLAPGFYSYRLKQSDRDGTSEYSRLVEVEIGSAPRVFALSQNYPNPFNPTTTIEFTLEHDGHVTLKVYDILGREVATLLDDTRQAGVYQQAIFDATRVSSGVYIAVLQSGGKQLLKKMLLLK